MIVGAVTVLLVHLLTQPYEKTHINIIEALVLVNFVTLPVLFLNPAFTNVPTWFSTLLLLAPYCYGVLYCIWALTNFI